MAGRQLAERRQMIDRQHILTIKRQAELLGMSRGSVYYRPRPVSEADLALMRRIDELHLDHPALGARQLTYLLQREGMAVGRLHVGTLMKRMGTHAICPQPGTSKAHPAHKKFPYLLRDLAITRANQVWALDTTYIPLAKGFVYLTAVVDVASRHVLAHCVATTLEACHAVAALGQAFAHYGVPEIINTDPGSQFTADDFVKTVHGKGCQLSMDGRGAWRDNVFVERLWRSLKYERVYLRAYESVAAARTDIAEYLVWYNQTRPHSSLGKRTPGEAYSDLLPHLGKAA
jgi:putative transposase